MPRTLLRDARYAVGRLGRDWRFTAASILILSLGIGANTAMFSLINATLFRTQSFNDPDRLVDIYQNGSNPEGMDANSYPAYLDIAEFTDVFAGTTAALIPRGANYLDESSLRPAVLEHTTASYLSVLGLRPSLGRWFDASEDTPGAPVTAVIGHEAWMRKFGGSASVIGRTIRMEGVPVTIVGIGPEGLRGTLNVGIITDFWLPIASLPAFDVPPRALDRRPDEAAFFVKARLREGVTVAQAQAAMDVLGARLASDYPDEDPGLGFTVLASNDVRVHPQMDGLLATIASLLLGVVALVLAIACSNMATLLLVRGTARSKEVSVRLALGATRLQLVRQLLTESLLLSSAGGIAGGLMAWWVIRVIGAFDLPVIVDLSLDYRVLLFAAAVSFVTGITFGLVPALKATRVDLVRTLRGDGDTRQPESRWFTLRNALVVFQVAVSVALLGGTSLSIQMLTAAQTGPVGFATDGVAMLEVDARYAGNDSASATARAYEEVRRRVGAIPGVLSAVLTRGMPMQTDGVAVIDAAAPAAAFRGDDASRTAGAIWVGPGYFEALRIPILFGRAIDERDRADTPRVAVISETMARQYSGIEHPALALGRRFRIDRDAPPDAWIEVVGVARDTGTADLLSDLVEPSPHLFYRSFAQWGLSPTTVVARTSGNAADLLAAMERELRTANPMLHVISGNTLARSLEESLAPPKTVATLLGALGALGLGLAGIGLYSVIAFAVSRRSREIGIRMALGARSRQVVGTVAREVAVLVGLGTAAGLAVTLVAIRVLGTVPVSTPGISLYRPGVEPLTLLAITAFMAVVGLTAAFVPARRAAAMNPLTALRRD